MGLQQDTNVCGLNWPAQFLQMLASTLMKDSDGVVLGFNYIIETTESCDCTPVIDCDNNHVPPETLLPLGFGLDACGRLALKLVNCDGTDTRQ
jgi:hypothetical protein